MAENDNIIIVDDISELDNYNVSTMDSESGTEYYNVAYWDPKDKQWKIYDEEKIKELRTEPLKLAKINENGTIGEMIETINENFRNLAAHGGGPSGQDGANGERGADGTNVEYIYCLCDEMEEDKQYPKNSGEKADLFNALQGSDTFTFTGKDGTTQTVWYNHAQPISKEHKNEYMLVRYKSYAGLWAYEEKPVLWSHWGETGVDGDGVEYIFLATKAELTGETFLKREDMDDFQKTVFNMNDFYPNSEWFNNDNKTKVKKEFEKKGLSISDSDFNTRWSNCFEFGGENRSLNWTDEPTGSGPEYPFEYVSIRRSNRDENDNLVWNDFSEPAVWSNYSYPSRTFIIYCNTNPEDSEDDEPEAPKVGQGWWDYETDTLVFDKPGHKIPSGWTDDNNNEEGKITWISSGIFKYTGENVSWSNPIRITGKNGQNGVDGESVEFIYALDNDPKYPSDPRERENLFDNVEDPKNEGSYDWSEGDDHTTWYDRAQAITAEHPNEYVASRHKAPRSNTWVYDTEPVLWAHWGEDGTDGDGIEYIFIVKNAESYDGTDITESDWENLWSFKNDTARTAYSMNDFVPNVGWFSNDHKTAVQTKMTKAGKTFVENDWNSMKTTFSLEWSDNPVGIDATNKYQYVSIRKSDDGVWGPFSYPKLWSKYNLTVFKSFAFTATSLFDDISSVVPTGGSFDNPVPTNPKTLNWYDVPTTEDGKPQIWMVSATFNDQVNGPVSGWSHPKKMNDTAEFQVEWSSADLTGTALANLRTDLGSDTYNLNHFYTNGELDEDAWRDEVETNLKVRFSDSSEGAILMATCQYAGGVWTNWELVRVKGENGNDGANGQPGADGNDGTPGIGYQYCYVRYTNDDESSYGGATSCTVTQASAGDDPVFKIGTATVASASVPQGADADHAYEYRSERSGYEGNWSLWSTPVTIAKYLNIGDISTEVNSAVETATQGIISSISAVNDRYSYISQFVSSDGNISGTFGGTFTNGVESGIISAVVTSPDLSNTFTSQLNGLITGISGVTTFADWIDHTNGGLNSAAISLNAMSGYASLVQDVISLSSNVANYAEQTQTATSDIAELRQNVARATYLIDDDGYFLVEENGTRRRAKDDNNQPTKNYLSICDADVSKLILDVNEITSIAQTVGEHNASIALIAAVSDTSSSDGQNFAAAIFMQANKSGSSIGLNAENITINASHILSLSAGTFEISSGNFTVDRNGSVIARDFQLNTGNTRIDASGTLYAQNAVISGQITADEFMASYTETSVSVSKNGNIYTGDIEKITTINGQQMQIIADGQLSSNGDIIDVTGNAIYFKIVNEMSNTNTQISDSTLYGVPALCMRYKGVEYILSPASWFNPNPSADTTNILWKYVQSISPYTFTTPTSGDYANGNISGVGTYYLFDNSTNKNTYIEDGSDDLYRVWVYHWGNYSSVPIYITDNNLCLINNPTKETFNDNSVFTIGSRIDSKYKHYDAIQVTPITDTVCNIYEHYLTPSLPGTREFTETKTVTGTGFYVNNDTDNSYNLFDICANFIELACNNSIWTDGTYVFIDDNNTFFHHGMYLPFTNNNYASSDYESSGNNTDYYFESPGNGKPGRSAELTLTYRPVTYSTNNGSTFGAISQIWVTASIEIRGTYGWNQGATYPHLSYEVDKDNPATYTLAPSYMRFNLDFNFILNLQTPINNFNPLLSSPDTSAILAKIKTFMENYDFYDYNNNDIDNPDYFDFRGVIFNSVTNTAPNNNSDPGTRIYISKWGKKTINSDLYPTDPGDGR